MRPETGKTLPHPVAIRHFCVMLLCAGVLLASLLLGVNARGQAYLPPFGAHPIPEICPFKRATGWPCAGCGLTRSTISITHGDWRRAWHFHRVGFLVYLFILGQLLYNGFAWQRARRGAEVARGRWTEYSAFALLALLLANWAWTLTALARG